jgi:hypothetical protein
MSNEAETFTMPLAGRDIAFRKANLGQVIMLQRLYVRASKSAQGQPDEDSRVDMMGSAMVKVLDFIDSLMVHEDDRAFVEEKMLAGEIDINDLTAALGGGKDSDAPADDQAPKPRKAAPKKSPKAAPAAKTLASRGSTKR